MPETHLAIQRRRIRELYTILYQVFKKEPSLHDVDTTHHTNSSTFYMNVESIPESLIRALRANGFSIREISFTTHFKYSENETYAFKIKVYKYNGLEMIRDVKDLFKNVDTKLDEDKKEALK